MQAGAIQCVIGEVPANARPIDGTITIRPIDAAASAPAVFATTNENLAADLAEALGLSTAEVERAIEAAQSEAPELPEEVFTAGVVAVTNDPEVLSEVADELSVTVDDLEAAVEATTGCPSSDDPGDGPAEVRIEAGDLFEAIAEELGDGITGDALRSAFEAAQPEGTQPHIVPARPATMFDLEALAEELGISVEELQEALESIVPRPQR
ncbi:MAG: hypothetical protein ACRDJ9_09660 [Dehalococcoidia bacterium]